MKYWVYCIEDLKGEYLAHLDTFEIYTMAITKLNNWNKIGTKVKLYFVKQAN